MLAVGVVGINGNFRAAQGLAKFPAALLAGIQVVPAFLFQTFLQLAANTAADEGVWNQTFFCKGDGV
mgnify:CR=1 FL=1